MVNVQYRILTLAYSQVWRNCFLLVSLVSLTTIAIYFCSLALRRTYLQSSGAITVHALLDSSSHQSRIGASVQLDYFSFSRLCGSGMLRTVTGYTGEKRTDIFKCNRQFGIHVGLHRVVLRVCRVFRYCSRPADGTSALPPPSLELARFRPPIEERAFRALELCAVTV